MPIFYKVEQKYYHTNNDGGYAFYFTEIRADKLPARIDEPKEDHDSFIDFCETKSEAWKILMQNCMLMFTEKSGGTQADELLSDTIIALIGKAIELAVEQDENTGKTKEWEMRVQAQQRRQTPELATLELARKARAGDKEAIERVIKIITNGYMSEPMI